MIGTPFPPVVLDQAWRNAAACEGMTDVFWPVPSSSTVGRQRQIAEAIAVCDTCPVIEQCAEYAEALSLVGVWGGVLRRDNSGRGRAS